MKKTTSLKNVVTSVKDWIWNSGFFVVGIAALTLNKIRYSIFGYTKPRPFSLDAVERATDYDFSVVANWQSFFREYTGKMEQEVFQGKTILEIGPGEDQGIALLSLALGAKNYLSFDVNNLVPKYQEVFSEKFLKRLQQEFELSEEEKSSFEREWRKAHTGASEKMRFIVSERFDQGLFAGQNIDLVVSQAAFEHFSDVEGMLKNLSQIVNEKAILIAEVDLATHTEWLRLRDVLNIYRYPTWLWSLFQFSGLPNRVRPNEYVRILERNGWENIRVYPKYFVNKDYLAKAKSFLAREFSGEESQMEWYGIVICATKQEH